METLEKTFHDYTKILKSELLTALGCTEPICIAYCSAVMRDALGEEPQKIRAYCSGNLVKNAKGATVPNSGGMKGIAASAILGAVGGDTARQLELLTAVTPEHIEHAKALLEQGICEEFLLDKEEDKLQVIIQGEAGGHTAEAELKYTHTNICRVERDGEPVPFNNVCEGLSVTDDWHCSFYVRLTASDRPGVLARITACLGDEGISIRNLMQRDAVNGHAQIVLITHDAGECAIRKALAAIASDDVQVESMIRVER